MGSMWVDPSDDVEFPVATDVQPEPFDPSWITPTDQFPSLRWAGDYEALLALAEFARTDWRANMQLRQPPASGSLIERDELVQLVQFQAMRRPGALTAILAQDRNFQSYFLSHMMIGRRSHHRAYLLLKIAARVGELVMATLKMYYNRSRPSQIYPQLNPPVYVAEHASYPSGHATVAYLMAFCAAEIVPGNAAVRSGLERLAWGIAINREYAGVHFRSDTVAGQEAAQQAFQWLNKTRWFKKALLWAREEREL